MIPSLQIKFLAENQVSEELQSEVNALDALAFSSVDQNEEPGFAGVEWASHDWMELGFMGDQLVSQLCLLKREIRVGETPTWVAGIGGLATDPKWQKQGFALQLLLKAKGFMKNQMGVPFGLLICSDVMQPYYARNGWKKVAQSLRYVQSGAHRVLTTCVMILPLDDQDWPAGEIDLCGLPW